MIVQVWYQVDVCAIVDTDEGTVDRVVVMDDDAELKFDSNERVVVRTTAYDDTVPDDVRVKAVKIAEEANTGWPRWEFGW